MLKNVDEIIELTKKIEDKFKSKHFRERFWPDYPQLPVALYNSDIVCISGYKGIPNGYKEASGVLIGEKDDRFYGNTSIKLEEQQIAIWDLNTVSSSISYEKLTSLIFHEGLHGYQSITDDKRWANELDIIEYPFIYENMKLRYIERKLLHKAIMSENLDQINEILSKFIYIRDKRKELISESINYELALESIEGTAMYLETCVYSYLSKRLLKEVIVERSSDLLNPEIKLKKFRMGCYVPGMILCNLLDVLGYDWKREYTNSDKYLYDFLKSRINFENCTFPLPEIEYNYEIEIKKSLENEESSIKKIFDDFFINEGYKVVLKGKFPLMGLDPMNIIWKYSFIMNKDFFVTRINEKTFYIKGKSVVKRIGKSFNFSEIIFFSPEKPLISEDEIEIKDLGKIRGELKPIGNTYIIEI